MTAAERWNLVRFRPESRAGHVESYFLKANEPGGARAVWIKFTVLAPIGRPEAAVAEVWAVAFDGRSGAHVAGKETFPIGRAELPRDRFRFEVGGSMLEGGATRGRIRAAGAGAGAGAGADEIAWDLKFDEGAPPLLLFPSEALYEVEAFPRSKLLSPHPDSRFEGRVSVGGAEWRVAGWPGMQGHNWGRGHALRYAWAHVNAFRDAPGTVFEGFSAKVRLGPVATPYLSLLFLRHRGRDFDFRGIRQWLSRDVSVGRYFWAFAAESEDARLAGRIEAPAEDFAGLTYEDPDGARAACLNSKIARARLELFERAGPRFEPIATLEADRSAALELLVRERDHGIRMLA
jgi:hypothetical protein